MQFELIGQTRVIEAIELKDLSSHLSIPQENSEMGHCDLSNNN